MLAKMEEDPSEPCHGHITSLAVLRSHRKAQARARHQAHVGRAARHGPGLRRRVRLPPCPPLQPRRLQPLHLHPRLPCSPRRPPTHQRGAPPPRHGDAAPRHRALGPPSQARPRQVGCGWTRRLPSLQSTRAASRGSSEDEQCRVGRTWKGSMPGAGGEAVDVQIGTDPRLLVGGEVAGRPEHGRRLSRRLDRTTMEELQNLMVPHRQKGLLPWIEKKRR